MSGATPRETDERRPIRVFVVDDHAVVRRGLEAYFEMVDDLEIVGEAADGRQALDRIAAMAAVGQAPDVVMMDLVMPGLDGITATSALRKQHPEIDVVAMTSFSEAERVERALQAGASGYVLKDAQADELASAIRAAHRGEVHLDAAITRRLTASLRAPQPLVDSLTKREGQVLQLVAQGLSNREIADRLFVSERTARTHVSNILTKLKLASRTQAALWAVRQGLAHPTSQSSRTGGLDG